MLKRLLSIRLSYFYPVVFFGFLYTLLHVHKSVLTNGQLTLFSVNSFLYAYYLGPILGSQKARVDDLIQTVRSENMVILDVLSQAHSLANTERIALKTKIAAYLDSIIDNDHVQAENSQYDELLHFLSQDKFKDNDVISTIRNRLSTTQQNRDKIALQMGRTMFSHEWLVLMVLFSITIYFVIQIDYGKSLLFAVIAALLCTGLSLLIFILAKFATLTHKQAKRMWVPLQQLRTKHFEDILPS
jgi:hypothetical protein